MRVAHRQGKALVLTRINVDGTLGPVWVAKATTLEFGAAALETVVRYRYSPARRNGEAIPFAVLLPVYFKLR